MSVFQLSSPRDRLKSALAAVAIQALLAWALVTGLAVHMPAVVERGLKTFDVPPVVPPPPPKLIVPHRVENARPEGEASPPNIRSKATEIVAPKPIVPPIVPPPPVVVAPKANTGFDASTGAADIPGPGTGAGGWGDGTGAGGWGDGDGAGGRGTPPRRIRGRIRDSDIPQGAIDAGVGGTVSVLYRVAVDGRVTDCEITRSSGSRQLDALTCRLIRERFRFSPSRDPRGRPVSALIEENHSWDIERWEEPYRDYP